MKRILLTFESLHKLLRAEKFISEIDNPDEKFRVRPTPTPPQISDTVCGMSLEILSTEQKDQILEHLTVSKLEPKNVHELDD